MSGEQGHIAVRNNHIQRGRDLWEGRRCRIGWSNIHVSVRSCLYLPDSNRLQNLKSCGATYRCSTTPLYNALNYLSLLDMDCANTWLSNARYTPGKSCIERHRL